MACQKPLPPLAVAQFTSVFTELIAPEKLAALCVQHAPLARTKPKLTTTQLVSGLIYHQLQPAGSLGQHTAQLHGTTMSESAHAQRRQGWPPDLFTEIMAAALRPLADPGRHPQAFFRGWRLVGIDGTEWSATNTPALRQALPKAATRRLSAAFAKVRLMTLVELGVHQPLGAVAAAASEGEQTLAKKLWPQVPDQSLLIGDRAFGTPRTLWEAVQAWRGREVAYLVRVRKNVQVKIVERLADGSAIVEVPVHAKTNSRKVEATLRLREIHAEGVGAGGQRFSLRLWTNLLDAIAYPALELATQYAGRWEQELYYRELKLDVRSSSLLTSHTMETALQELAALVLAMAVVAQVRVAAADQLAVPPLRVSFLKILILTQQLWHSFGWGRRGRTPAQARAICDGYFADVRLLAILPERRKRSCPRVVRQPVSSWPRKLDPKNARPASPSHPTEIKIVRLP